MVKATITMPTGTKVVVEGSTEDVERLLGRLGDDISLITKKHKRPSSTKKTSKRSQSITDYVIELREAGLFKNPQSLSDVRTALASEGHVVPITTLSGRMLDIVKAKQLRRIRDGKVWKYVNR